MKQNYAAGTYIDYPCSQCGHKMQIKDNLIKSSATATILIECPDCNIKKEYNVAELKAVINA
ncbi:MAG: hypothetical protein ACQERJ_08045 [Bacillota bacterium]